MPSTLRDKSNEKKSFIHGFAAAVGTLARAYDRPEMAADILRSNGLDFQDLEDAGVEEFDLNVLRSEFQI